MTKKNDESIFIDFIYDNGSIPDGYTATYIISDSYDIKKTGDLTLNIDKFELRIKKGELENLRKARYRLEVIVTNEDLGYSDYIYSETLIIM